MMVDPETKPVLTIEEFFDGNLEDGVSIGCNLVPSIPLSTFRRVLEEIRGRHNVHAVWLAVAEFDHDLKSPFVDEVLVLTSARRRDLETWFTELRPSEIEAVDAAPIPPRCQNHEHAEANWFCVFWD